MIKPTINTVNTYLQRPSTHQQPIFNTSTIEREPGEDDAGIAKVPLQGGVRWSLADWLASANGDFHVRATLTGDVPISRGVFP